MHRSSLSYQARLIVGFTAICLLVGLLSLGVGISIVNQGIIIEVTNRVSQDLNAAWALFEEPMDRTEPVFRLAAGDKHIIEAAATGVVDFISHRMLKIKNALNLDFAGALLLDGEPLRISPDGSLSSIGMLENDFRLLSAERRTTVRGVSVLSEEFLLNEDPQLAEQARTQIVKTPRAAEREEYVETRGLALVSASPVITDGKVIALLYGGVLVNRNIAIVDRIKEVLFQLETYKDLELGTATVFLEDVRVATNVVDSEGRRAIGTQVSKEVKDHVLGEGLRWSDRAFVVKNWYRTAYDPIVDIAGDRIGMLYVGILEAKYRDYQVRTLALHILITTGGIAAGAVTAYFLSRLLLHPVNKLIDASREVSEGHLEPDIGSISRTEIGLLQNTFLNMLASFRERVERQDEETSAKLLQSEKQAIVGRLAAGVAHEINNPLTSVLTFTYLLLERNDLPEDAKKDLRIIAESTERVRKTVRGLLDYSRREALEQVETDLNELIESTLLLLDKQIKGKERKLIFEPAGNLPRVTVDRNQIDSVLVNLLINAADAITGPGTITVSTRPGISDDRDARDGVEITITDTGKGIRQEDLENIFDPFFTTKEAGRGTGLGLAVSKNIVDRHRGTIRVRSEVGKGSSFTLWLPLDKPPAADDDRARTS